MKLSWPRSSSRTSKAALGSRGRPLRRLRICEAAGAPQAAPGVGSGWRDSSLLLPRVCPRPRVYLSGCFSCSVPRAMTKVLTVRSPRLLAGDCISLSPFVGHLQWLRLVPVSAPVCGSGRDWSQRQLLSLPPSSRPRGRQGRRLRLLSLACTLPGPPPPPKAPVTPQLPVLCRKEGDHPGPGGRGWTGGQLPRFSAGPKSAVKPSRAGPARQALWSAQPCWTVSAGAWQGCPPFCSSPSAHTLAVPFLILVTLPLIKVSLCLPPPKKKEPINSDIHPIWVLERY